MEIEMKAHRELMKYRLTCYILLLSIICGAQNGMRGLKPINQSDLKRTGGDKYILTIGIDHYTNWLDLENARNDALGVSDIFENKYGYKNIVAPILNTDASKDRLEEVIYDIIPNKLQPEDELLIYYAGHGHVEEKRIGSRVKQTGYLIPSDGDLADSRGLSSYIQIDQLLDHIAELPAFHISVIFDACHTGIALKNSIGLTKSRGATSVDYSHLTDNMSRNLLVSAGWDQVAYDSGSTKGHSLFTGILLNGLESSESDLNADGYITLSEIVMDLQNEFRMRGVDQYPRNGSWSDYHDGGEMVLKTSGEKIIIKREHVEQLSDKSVVTILPFRPLSESEENTLGQYVSNHAVESIENNINNLTKFKVVNPVVFRDILTRDGDISDVNLIELTRADIYFTGTYIEIGEKYIFNIKLIDAKDLTTITTLKSVFTDKNDPERIAKDVSNLILVYLADDKYQYLDLDSDPPNYKAYKLYKKSLQVKNPYYYEFNNPDYNRIINLKRSLMDQALALDETFVQAHIQKAFLYYPDLVTARKHMKKVEANVKNPSDYEKRLIETTIATQSGKYYEAFRMMSDNYHRFEDKFSLYNGLLFGRLGGVLDEAAFFLDNVELDQYKDDQPFLQKVLKERARVYTMSRKKGPLYEYHFKMLEESYHKIYLRIVFDDDFTAERAISLFDEGYKANRYFEAELHSMAHIALANNKEELAYALYSHLIKVNEENFDILNLKWVIYAHFRMKQYNKVFELYEKYGEDLLSQVKWDGDYKSLIKITEYGRFAFPVLASEILLGKEKHSDQILDNLKRGDEVKSQICTYRIGLYYDLIGEEAKALDYFQKAIATGDVFGVLDYFNEPQLLDRYPDHTYFYKQSTSEY